MNTSQSLRIWFLSIDRTLHKSEDSEKRSGGKKFLSLNISKMTLKIYRDIEQQSEEWFKIRLGKMTASHAQAIGNTWKWLETYIIDMMAEYYSCEDWEKFSNEHTDRGNELEGQARGIYELENMCSVEQVSFIEYNDFIGCSPDGFVWEDWWLEIKCPMDKAHFRMILKWVENSLDSWYVWQCQHNLWVTKRKWWDIAFYNPNYEKSLIVHRIYPDPEKFAKLEAGFEVGMKMIREIRSQIGR
jgi:hypothetical protein